MSSPDSSTREKTALLLVNLGTPLSPSPEDVKNYLGEFLMDPYVITLPKPLRWLLVKGIIQNVRSRKSARKYQSIWKPEGSPLLIYSLSLAAAIKEKPNLLPEIDFFSLAMRYGKPDLENALLQIHQANCHRVVVFPLYPQYALSTTETVRARILEICRQDKYEFNLCFVPPFYRDPRYIQAMSTVIREFGTAELSEHVLFSFHGLPESHITALDPSHAHCLRKADCCDEIGLNNQNCYRAHCFTTMNLIAKELRLSPEKFSMSFQSRLGRGRWLTPTTEETILRLASLGVKKLTVVTPSFVSDCLETLEEIGIEMRKLFLTRGGTHFDLVPCLNSHPSWVEACRGLVSSTLNSNLNLGSKYDIQ